MVDFVRGLALLDMMLVHYSPWLDCLSRFSIPKLISYSDFAVEGFVLLAGFVVGSRYLDLFLVDQRSVIVKLVRRVCGIVGLQWVMVLTLSLPVAAIVGSALTKSDTLTVFVVKSVLFLNQVPLLHILPAFLPLFLLAIPVLFLLRSGHEYIVGVGSIALFAVGNWYPHLPWELWENAIFPPLLWQVYFVIGILVGKHEDMVRRILKQYGQLFLGLAIAILIVMLFVDHGHHVSSWWSNVQLRYNLAVRKFPLNYLGLFYHGSFLLAIVAISNVGWRWLKTHPFVLNPIMSLGRNSLVLFIVHVYIGFVVMYVLGKSWPIAFLAIILNVAGAFFLSRILDSKYAAPLFLRASRT